MHTSPRLFFTSSLKPILSIVFLFLAVILPSSASAQSSGVTLTVSPSALYIGQQITVNYSVATTSFRSSDDIIMVDAATRRMVTSQNIGTVKVGQKVFTTRTPGTYYFQYRAAISGYPILATSSNVVVSLPDASSFTLSPSATSLESGQPLVVAYSGPAFSHNSSDDIVVIDAATNRQVSIQSLGTSPSGTKTFILRNPGTYIFQYRLAITGLNPVVKTAGPITVRLPDTGLYGLSLSATTRNSGEPVVVTYNAPSYAHQSTDDIVVIDTATNRQVATQSVGTSPSGTKTFTLRNPGSYIFQYKMAITGTPVMKTTGPLTVRIPDASLYTLFPSRTTLNSGEPLVVTYASPIYAHQYGDDIVVIDTATNRQVATQSVGTSPSGTKTFTLRNPGSYIFQYKMAISGTPIVKTAGPVTVTVPDASLFTLSSDLAVAEVGQPITIAFASPSYAYQSTDDIIVYETATGKIVGSTNVGSSPSGTKIFKMSAPGTYTFAYRMNVSGLPIVKRSGNVVVTYVNLARIKNYPLRSGPIIALGDSITYGRDANIGQDYVSLLSQRIGEPIQNAGVNGDTTAGALARLETDVLSKDPRLVIVFLGGNDFLQKIPTDTIFTNLGTIVDRIHGDGAAVLILGYKDYFLIDYDARYRDLAWSKGAAYAPDVMGGILGNPFYTTDLIHPRSSGHKIIADRVEPYLRALIGQ